MCTLVILRRPDHDWPLLVAANRDEMGTRPWKRPARHWDDRPDVVAGLDETAGGSWLGLNDHGLIAGVLNRPGSLGPAEGKRSRGELVLEALDHADADVAAKALAELDPAAYRPFNLVIADDRNGFWLRSDGKGIRLAAIPEGLSMITSSDLNDAASPRIRDYLPRFRAAAVPDPERDDWADWQALMGQRDHAPEAGPRGAVNIVTDTPYGTVSSSLIAMPAYDARWGVDLQKAGDEQRIPGQNPPKPPIWLFAAGHPDETGYQRVKL
ncbi:MAG TPA: NRDE family protein [Alphaproteobacteria bacterium]